MKYLYVIPVIELETAKHVLQCEADFANATSKSSSFDGKVEQIALARTRALGQFLERSFR